MEKCISILNSGKSRFGINENIIREGEVANFSLFNPNTGYMFDKNHIHSTSKNSAFLGIKMKGKPLGIIVGESFLINE